MKKNTDFLVFIRNSRWNLSILLWTCQPNNPPNRSTPCMKVRTSSLIVAIEKIRLFCIAWTLFVMTDSWFIIYLDQCRLIPKNSLIALLQNERRPESVPNCANSVDIGASEKGFSKAPTRCLPKVARKYSSLGLKWLYYFVPSEGAALVV